MPLKLISLENVMLEAIRLIAAGLSDRIDPEDHQAREALASIFDALDTLEERMS
jgi:hypothetical protein